MDGLEPDERFAGLMEEIKHLDIQDQIKAVLEYDAYWSDGQNVERSTDVIMSLLLHRAEVKYTYYRSCYKERVWCESRDPHEVLDASEMLKPEEVSYFRQDYYSYHGNWKEWSPIVERIVRTEEVPPLPSLDGEGEAV